MLFKCYAVLYVVFIIFNSTIAITAVCFLLRSGYFFISALGCWFCCCPCCFATIRHYSFLLFAKMHLTPLLSFTTVAAVYWYTAVYCYLLFLVVLLAFSVMLSLLFLLLSIWCWFCSMLFLMLGLISDYNLLATGVCVFRVLFWCCF